MGQFFVVIVLGLFSLIGASTAYEEMTQYLLGGVFFAVLFYSAGVVNYRRKNHKTLGDQIAELPKHKDLREALDAAQERIGNRDQGKQ